MAYRSLEPAIYALKRATLVEVVNTTPQPAPAVTPNIFTINGLLSIGVSLASLRMTDLPPVPTTTLEGPPPTPTITLEDTSSTLTITLMGPSPTPTITLTWTGPGLGSSPEPSGTPMSNHQKNTKAIIIGVTVVAGILAVVILGYVVYRMRQRSTRHRPDWRDFKAPITQQLLEVLPDAFNTEVAPTENVAPPMRNVSDHPNYDMELADDPLGQTPHEFSLPSYTSQT